MCHPGVPLLYGWPSQGGTEDHFADEDANVLTRPHLAEFLRTIASAGSGERRLDVIAHSMGNRALCEVLSELATTDPGLRIHHLVLAAPDIDARRFVRDLWPRLQTLCDEVSLYASSDDAALAAPSGVHQNHRLGQSGDDLVVLDGMATVDASGVDTSLLGHSYVSEVERVLDDLAQALCLRRAPLERGLHPRSLGTKAYWVFP